MTRAPETPFPDKLAELGAVGDAGALAHYSDPAYYTRIYKNRRHDVEYYVENLDFTKYVPLRGPWLLRLHSELSYGDAYGETTALPPFRNRYGGGPGSVRAGGSISNRGGAFAGMNRGGSNVRAASTRGSISRGGGGGFRGRR